MNFIVKALKPISGALTVGGSSTKRKRRYKYQVKVKGVQISKHYTKSAAVTRAKSVRGGRVTPIGARKKRY